MTTSEMRNFLLRISLKNLLMICILPQLTPYFKSNIIVSKPRHSMQSMTSTIILIVLVLSIQMAATSDPNVRSTRSRILFDMDLSRLTRVLIHLILIILSLGQSMVSLKSSNGIIALVAFLSAKSRIWQALERSHVISRTSHFLPMKDVFFVQWKNFLAN